MAKPKLSPEQLAALEELAQQWGKIVANRAYGEAGPDLDVDFDQMEQIAAAATAGLVEGTLEHLTQQQAQRLPDELPCPTCQKLCELKRRPHQIVARGATVTLQEPVARCNACRQDFSPQRIHLRLDSHGYSPSVLAKIIRVVAQFLVARVGRSASAGGLDDVELHRVAPPSGRVPQPHGHDSIRVRVPRRSIRAGRAAGPWRLHDHPPLPRAPVQRPRGGPAHDHGPHDRLLMALVWLRTYPTYEVLGFFFDLHKRNAQLNVRAVLDVLDTLHDFPFDRPTRDRTKLRSAAEVMTAFPQVRVVIDGKEQRTNRPTGYDVQKPYYSGKKKAHALENQVVVDPYGRIEAVTSTLPGGANHDVTVLRGSGVLERLVEVEGAMVDKGYVGVKNDYPDVPVVIPFKASRNHPLSDPQRAFNREVARHRIVVEHTMAQLNWFTVLRQVFRAQKRESHSRVFRVVAKLSNRRLAIKPLKAYAV